MTFTIRLGYLLGWGQAMVERGRAAWLCGDLTNAESDLRAALEVFQNLNAAFDFARALFFLAAFLHEQGQKEAGDIWRKAVQKILSGGYAFLLEQERHSAFPLLAAYTVHADASLARVSNRLLRHLERVPPPPLSIKTLGRFEVRRGWQIIDRTSLRCRRAGELMALLLFSPLRTLSFDQIVETLWPDKPPHYTKTAFHHTTSALRRALEPDLPEKFPSRYLIVDEGQITLDLPLGSWVDFEAFEKHYRLGQWEQALNLYIGDLLPELRYSEWVFLQRERLALLYQRALLGAGKERYDGKRYAEALDACLQLLALEPWHEEATLLGMQACVAMKDIATARRLYIRLERKHQSFF